MSKQKQKTGLSDARMRVSEKGLPVPSMSRSKRACFEFLEPTDYGV